MKLCPPEGIPEGKPKAFEILPNRWIGVFHVRDRFYAVQDECPHQGWSLSAGRVEKNTVSCAGHGWSFYLDTGKVVGAGELHIETYPLKIEQGCLWVDI